MLCVEIKLQERLNCDNLVIPEPMINIGSGEM